VQTLRQGRFGLGPTDRGAKESPIEANTELIEMLNRC
jgi:hypothetical protein